VSIIRRLLGIPDKLDSLDKKVDTVMTNQETANQLAADISEDVEVLARISDQYVNANKNLQTQLKDAQSALAAAGVDFTPIMESAGQLDSLTKALSSALNPVEPTPPVESIPEVPVVVTDPPVDVPPVLVDGGTTDGAVAEDSGVVAESPAAADTTTGTDAGTSSSDSSTS
jgi:hypothetical protein